MSNVIKKYRFLLARRIVQIAILILFIGANVYGWTILTGNLSSAIAFGVIPLSDPYAVMQMLATGFIGGSSVLIGALIVLLFYALLVGRSFCSWVCPMNIVSDVAVWIRRRIGLKDEFLSLSRQLRFWILALSFIVSAFVGVAAFEMISPVAMLHRGIIFGMGAEFAVIAALFLFDLGVKKNAWCGYMCPLGAFYSFIGKYALLKIKHSASTCTNCGECFDVCPEHEVLDIVGKKNGIIKSGACNNCGRCIEICPDKALFFSINDYKKVTNKE